jgi:hypothetical protein
MIDWRAFDDLFLFGLALCVVTVVAILIVFRSWR